MKVHYIVKKFDDGKSGIAACDPNRTVILNETGTRHRRRVTCKACKRYLKVLALAKGK